MINSQSPDRAALADELTHLASQLPPSSSKDACAEAAKLLRSPSPYSGGAEKTVADELAKALLMNMFAHDTQLIEGWKSKSDVKWLVALGFVTDEVLPYRSPLSYSGAERYCPICDSPAVGSNGYCNGHQDLAPTTLPRDAERETIERGVPAVLIAALIGNIREYERYGSIDTQVANEICLYLNRALVAGRALPSIPPREGPVQSTTERLVTAKFEEVSCQQLSQCGWPECDCPRKDHVPKASAACPICGVDTPHYHSPERERCSGCMIETCEDCFDQDAIRSLQSTTEQADASRDHPVREAEATFGEDGYNPAYDDGITFAIIKLAELTDSKDWQMRDGSEDHDTDVCDTIMDVLKCAGLYDDETGKFAALSPSPTSVMPDEGK